MEKKLRIHGFTCLYIQVQPSHAREPNTQLAHLLYILWDGMSSPGPTHHSKRCPFLPGVISKRPILPIPHPLPTPPRIYMHNLDICYTYIYICRFTPPTLLPRQGHATPGTRTAPRRRWVALAVQAAPAPLLRPPRQPEQGIPRIGPPPAPPPAPRLPYPRPQQRVSDNKKRQVGVLS